MSHMEFIHLLGIIPGHLCPAWNRNVTWVLNRRAMRKAAGEVAVLVRFLARPTMLFDIYNSPLSMGYIILNVLLPLLFFTFLIFNIINMIIKVYFMYGAPTLL